VKVALLSDCYLPRLGGIEVQVHDLAGRLRGRGHDVHVFTATPGAHGERGGFVDDVDGVPVHRMALRLPFDLPVNPLAPPLLRRLLADGRYDVAHVHTGIVSPFAVDCARVTVGLGLPTAMTWHCMIGRLGPAFAAAGYVRRWAERGVAMSAVSQVAAAPLQRIIGAAGTVSVLPNGIDIGRWSPRSETGAHARRPGATGIRVVTAMRLAARKRPIPLLRLMARARELVPPDIRLELLVLGDGPDRGRVERFVREHGMSSWVDLPGRVPRGELPSRYAGAHVFIAPARLESFGIAALEARVVGLPVVARAGSGVGEFVTDGVNGLLAGDDEGLAAAVARLATDRPLLERMTAYNREHAPRQTWDRVVVQAEAEYARAIALFAARRPSAALHTERTST